MIKNIIHHKDRHLRHHKEAERKALASSRTETTCYIW